MSPSKDAVVEMPGPLMCSYPGLAVEMPNGVFDNADFQSELANFLSRASVVDSDVALPSPADPQYINVLLNDALQSIRHAAETPHLNKCTALFSGTLPGVSRIAEVPRITKRVHDYISQPQRESWYRSPLWLLIRVVIQLSVIRPLGRSSYKAFVLFFMCTLPRDECNTKLSSDLLHLMLSTVLRRLNKLGSSTPDWLSEMALKTWSSFQAILDARWKQLDTRQSPFRNPSQDELVRDTQLSLLSSCKYIRNALADHGQESIVTPFSPDHRPRGTIKEFLSSDETFFDEAYMADPDVTLYDVEQSMEEGIDDWLASVGNVDNACAQLDLLMDKYTRKAHFLSLDSNQEYTSIMFLTVMELFVAVDKLVVQKIPMLADYPPPFPMALLENMFLRRSTSLHRLSCAYQYLCRRHSQSRPGWSAISDQFTEDSFPVRYFNQSLYLQQLKACIEEDAMKNMSEISRFQHAGACLTQS